MFWDGLIIAAGLGWLLAALRSESMASWIVGLELLWFSIIGVLCWQHERRIARRIREALEWQFAAHGDNAAIDKVAHEIAETGSSSFVELWQKYGKKR